MRRRRPIEHGTIHGYRVHRCRCDLCRASNAERTRRNAKAREINAETPYDRFLRELRAG